MVLSLFWIVGLFLTVRPDQTYREYSAAKADLGENNGFISPATLSDRADELLAAGNEKGANELRAMAEIAERTPKGRYKTEKRVIFEGHLKTLKEKIRFMFLPIVLSFMIGACLVWALRGFRRRPSA